MKQIDLLWILWLFFVVIWNFGWPEAYPITDVIIAVILSVILNHLKKKYLKNQFTLILGQDNMEHFVRWKEYQQILEQFQIFVYPRSQSNKIPETFLDHPKVVYFKAPLLNISASEIRDALVKKKLLVDFLPPKIQDYLLKFNFYN